MCIFQKALKVVREQRQFHTVPLGSLHSFDIERNFRTSQFWSKIEDSIVKVFIIITIIITVVDNCVLAIL